jgi:hypothetical protein
MARSLGAIRTKQESQERRLDARGFRWQPVHRCGLVEGIVTMLNELDVRCRSEARMLNASVIGLRNQGQSINAAPITHAAQLIRT